VLIAANFKTFKTRQETLDYYRDVKTFIEKNKITVESMIFPTATSLNMFRGSTVVGAQNAYPVVNGAFTGEIGLNQLKEFGVKTILIGHSERRHIMGESQELLAQKFNFFKEQGFTIVFCIGEPLEVREEGSEKLMAYLDEQLDGIDLNYEKLILAYEPVWAIGTGLTPSSGEIELIHTALRQKIKAPILYGGSVKVNNAKELLSLENVDGALIGSGALQAENFCTILEIAQALNK